MDWLQFIAALVSALAWPAVVVVIICLLRKPIIELIPALRRLKLKELELEFRDKLADAEKTMVTVTDQKTKEEKVQLLREPSHYHELAQISPSAALAQVWVEVEAAASDLYQRRFGKPGTEEQGKFTNIRVQPKKLFEHLREEGVITNEEYHRAEILRDLRNKAVHQLELSEVNSELIEVYVTLALDLARALKKK